MADHYSVAGPIAWIVVASSLVLIESIAGPQAQPVKPAAAPIAQHAPHAEDAPAEEASEEAPAVISKSTSATLPMSFPTSTREHHVTRLQGEYALHGVRLEEIRLQQIASNFASRIDLYEVTPRFADGIDTYVHDAMAKIRGIADHQEELLASESLGESETLLRRALLTEAQKQLFVIKAFKDEQAECGDARFE